MPYQDPYYTDCILSHHKHYRLRVGKLIVGFMKERQNGNLSFSKDTFWWTNQPISYDETDRFAGVLDANRQLIFEHDIVKIRKYKENDYTKRGWIVWDSTEDKHMIKLFEEDASFSLSPVSPESPFRDDLKVVSHLFMEQ